MNTTKTKYRAQEILDIIRADYKQQQQYDFVALKDEELTFETHIMEWRDICDLVDTNHLWKYLNYYFGLQVDYKMWQTVLELQDKKTLGDLCHFIAMYAEKEIIQPVKLFGETCETAAIFRSFIARLKNRGIDTGSIKPSSELEPLVKAYNALLIQEINLMEPTVLPPVQYKSNWLYKWGLRLFIFSVFVTIFLAWRQTEWALLTGGLCVIGYVMLTVGARMEPKQASFEGINTVADLIRRMAETSTLTSP